MKCTKIVCTIGPKSHDKKTLTRMAKAGMDIVRMNFSHGSYDFHKKTIELTKKVSVELDKYIGILIDLQGPKIRTGKLRKDSVILNKGDYITLTTENVEGDWKIMSINYQELPGDVRIGEKILVDDGNIELRVVETLSNSIRCKIINSGEIRSFRGINLPETKISTPSLTEKDLNDLDFGLKNGVDFVALSFVRKPDDILDLKDKIIKKGRKTKVIAKIEKPEAVKNIDEIIDVSDGIMVARGDLGAETSPQDVPILQKMIIKKCNLKGKPVITATQMLESMINNPKPTRAEATDVANAIFDGTDAVMLSGETTIGKYPVTAVKVMSDIAKKAEKEIIKNRRYNYEKSLIPEKGNIADSVSCIAVRIAELVKTKFVVSFTMSGRTASLISKYRPSVPIIAMSPNETVLRELSIFWGVYGVYIEKVKFTEKIISLAEISMIEKKLCKEEDVVIMVGGVPVLAGEPTNMIKVHKVKIGNRNI